MLLVAPLVAAVGATLVAIGSAEALLTAVPLLVIAALLICGRFPGEERILARRAGRSLAGTARRAAQRWQPSVERALVSALTRSPASRRGPPRALARAPAA